MNRLDNFFQIRQKDFTPEQRMAWENKILWVIVGSNLYGTNTPDSDEDYMGIFMPDEDYVVGLKRIDESDLSLKSKKKDGRNDKDAVDDKFYEFRQFVNLALQNNPNVLEVLFVPDQVIKFTNELGLELLSHADLFPHRGAINRFLNYAYSQKHKMIVKTENYFDLKAADQFFSEYVNQETRKKLLVELRDLKLPFLKEKQNHFRIGDLDFDKTRHLAKIQSIVKDRLLKASSRTKLMEKYGHDTRFSSHLVRLMMEGCELLETGRIEFPLKERELVLDIKQGKYSTKEVLTIAEQHEAKIKSMFDNGQGKLRKKVMYKEVQQLTKNMLKKFLRYIS